MSNHCEHQPCELPAGHEGDHIVTIRAPDLSSFPRMTAAPTFPSRRDPYVTQLEARVRQLEAELNQPKHRRWQAPINPETP